TRSTAPSIGDEIRPTSKATKTRAHLATTTGDKVVGARRLRRVTVRSPRFNGSPCGARNVKRPEVRAPVLVARGAPKTQPSNFRFPIFHFRFDGWHLAIWARGEGQSRSVRCAFAEFQGKDVTTEEFIVEKDLQATGSVKEDL